MDCVKKEDKHQDNVKYILGNFWLKRPGQFLSISNKMQLLANLSFRLFLKIFNLL